MLRIGTIYNTRTGGVGQVLYLSVLNDLTPKKSSLVKIFGSNLFLKNRILVSTPTKPYASLREARSNFSEKEASLFAAHLYAQIREYFMANS